MSSQASARNRKGFQTLTRCARTARLGVLALLAVIALILDLTASAPARADSIYIGSGGIGFTFGTGGYGGGVFYGRGGYYGGRGIYAGRRGYYGRAYRPFRAPHFNSPYYRQSYPYRSRVYVNPPVQLGQPQRVPYTKTGLAPFTPNWVAYCARKFKSFNPNTGTYLAYSGKYRFCR